MNKNIMAYENLLNDYVFLYEKVLAEKRFHKINSLKHLMSQFITAKNSFIEKDASISANFNPLKLFNLELDENSHSNIIAWLFDPYETHSQGNIFFKAFLDYFDYEATYADYEYQVIREFSGQESIVDILVYSKEFIFYIENKVLSLEGDNQTDREFSDMIRLAASLNIEEKKSHAIYLSPSGIRPQNENFKAISYLELARSMETTLESIASKYIRLFLGSWLMTIKAIRR